MRSDLRKTMWISLSLTSMCAILLVLVLSYFFLELRLRVLFAQDQVRVFVSMRNKAHEGDVQHAIDCLEYTLAYYPTGTKQVESSPLNEIVESARKLAIKDMITLLRHKSNRDFGTDPKLWIKNRAIFGREEGVTEPIADDEKQ